jgi:hypothetical protein
MIDQNNDFISNAVINLSSKISNHINKSLIEPMVEKFFAAQGIKKYSSIKNSDVISDLDFKSIDFFRFYEIILADIKKTDATIEITTKYHVTIDKKSCETLCNKSNIYFDKITLGDTPIFYFIYIDVNEIMSFVRASTTMKKTVD